VKDYLIPHIVEKKMTKEMYDALIALYQSVNISRKMHLRNKLFAICMSDIDFVASYLMKIIELRDQLAAIGVKVEDEELVPIALNGFSPSWKPFV
jgi:hypothetical protein